MSRSVEEEVPSVLVVCYTCEPGLVDPMNTTKGYRTTNTETYKCLECNGRNIEKIPAGMMSITRLEGDEDELNKSIN